MIPKITRRIFLAGLTASAGSVLFGRPTLGAGFPIKDQRIALVIGNSKYKYATRLNSPESDAKAVAGALRRLGYDVRVRLNSRVRELEKEIAEFSRRASISNMAVMYYSGHGMQANERNYFIATDADPLVREVEVRDVASFGIPVNWAVEAVQNADAIGILMLDACRDNPFKKVSHLSAAKPGLAPVNPKGQLLVCYATQANEVALDGNRGELGPYANALLAHIEDSNLRVQDIFERVVTTVCDLTSSAAVAGDAGPYTGCQRPAVYSTLGAVPVFLTKTPDGQAKASASPILVNIKMANPEDPAVAKLLGENNDQFHFRYLWKPSAEKRATAQITPDLDYFVSAERRGRPLIFSPNTGYYEPEEGDTVWSLSYPILDIIARRIVTRPVEIRSLVFESRASRKDNTPYLEVVTPDKVGFLTLVNQSWQKISEAKLEFNVLGKQFGDPALREKEEIEDYIDKHRDGPFQISVVAKNINDSIDVSLIEALGPVFPDISMFAFASEHWVDDESGRIKVSTMDEKPQQVQPPAGFEEWYRANKTELETNVAQLMIAGRLTSIGEDSSKCIADFAADLTLSPGGAGAGTIDYDLINYVVLPIDGKKHVLTKRIGKTLRHDKQTFRGLFPLTARQTSFHELRFSLKDEKGNLLFQSPWAETHIVVSRNDKIASLGKRWTKY